MFSAYYFLPSFLPFAFFCCLYVLGRYDGDKGDEQNNTSKEPRRSTQYMLSEKKNKVARRMDLFLLVENSRLSLSLVFTFLLLLLRLHLKNCEKESIWSKCSSSYHFFTWWSFHFISDICVYFVFFFVVVVVVAFVCAVVNNTIHRRTKKQSPSNAMTKKETKCEQNKN